MLKKVRFLLAFVALSICLCLMSSTYSRYVADTTSNVDVLFAKWQILVNTIDITDGTNSSISFTPVMDANTNVANNVIAPTSKGHFDVNIDPTNVDVSFKYDIALSIANENAPDIKITGYSLVPVGYVEGTALEVIPIENNLISNTLIFDKLTENFKFNPLSIRIYFEWYEGENETMNDETDTTVGLNAAKNINSNIVMNANITFEQLIG